MVVTTYCGERESRLASAGADALGYLLQIAA